MWRKFNLQLIRSDRPTRLNLDRAITDYSDLQYEVLIETRDLDFGQIFLSCRRNRSLSDFCGKPLFLRRMV